MTTLVGPLSAPIHSPNSSALETVAERQTTDTESGRWIRISSQTAPPWRAWMARTWKSSSGKGKPAANRSMFMAASSVGGRQAAPERDTVLRGEDAAANQVFAEQAGERFGRLQVRQMPGALDDFQA